MAPSTKADGGPIVMAVASDLWPVSGQGVRDDAARNRFVLAEDGIEAELVYQRKGRRLRLIHTGVPDELGGRGIGGRLVSAAVEQARSEGLTLVPLCPFARAWLRRHPDVASTVSIDWPPDPARPDANQASAPPPEGS